MFDEQRNLDILDAEPPSGFGYRLRLRPTRTSAAIFLERFLAVWKAVAAWGRFCDEAGDWPSHDACIVMLPKDFAHALRESHSADIDGWLDDLHDREWVFWRARIVGDQIELDLDAESMPISAWPLRLVAELLDAEVVEADLISVLEASCRP